jgi:rod shape-determining protein MreD
MAARPTAFWVFIIILVLLHLTVRVGFGITAGPDLLVAALLLGARRLGGAAAAAYGLVLGVLADALAMIAFGATAVAFVVAGYIGARSRNLFEGDSYLFVAGYVFGGAWLIAALHFVVSGAAGRGHDAMLLLTQAPVTALITAVTAAVALAAYRAVSGYR